MMWEPIEKRKTYELIADQLLGEIGTRLRPGDPLPTERELTASFKVGRSSVREGLRMLESKGVIESVGNGTFVVSELRSPLNRSLALLLSLEEGNLRELYELRRMLEGEAAALAAARRSDEDLATMAEAIERHGEGPRRPRHLRGRRRALPRRRRRGDRQPRRAARDARHPRPAGARAGAGLRDPGQRRALARAAPPDPRRHRRPATPRRLADACAPT